MQPFIESLLESELEDTESTGTLLRANSIVSKAMTAFVRLPENMAYLRCALAEPIAALTKMKTEDIEINPEFASINTSLELNLDRMRKMIKQFIDAICNSVAIFPKELRQLCTLIRTKCSAKFPQAPLQPVGNVIILRFIAPAIVTKYSLV